MTLPPLLQQLIDKADAVIEAEKLGSHDEYEIKLGAAIAIFANATTPTVVKALVEVALVAQREVSYEQELEKNPGNMGLRQDLSWARHFRTEAVAHLNDVLKEQI